jgi:DNA-binding CsgD family transcriptional regulator
MTRRPGSHRDPTERQVGAEFALDQLAAVLKTVSELERGVVLMRYGLLDYEPKTLDEIGQRYGVTRERIGQIERKIMSKLRHPSRAEVLRDYLVDGIAQLPDQVRARILGEPVTPTPMAQCERHGWFRPYPDRATCGNCPCPLPTSWTGRPPSYCTPACRQAAYRRRRNEITNQHRATRRAPKGA